MIEVTVGKKYVVKTLANQVEGELISITSIEAILRTKNGDVSIPTPMITSIGEPGEKFDHRNFYLNGVQ